MKLLSKQQEVSYKRTKIGYISGNSLKINMLMIKHIVKIHIIVITQVNIKVMHTAFVIQNIVYLKKLL